MKVVSPREGSISNIRTFLKANIDTQNDAMFEAGDTFSKPFLASMLDFGVRRYIYIFTFTYLEAFDDTYLGWNILGIWNPITKGHMASRYFFKNQYMY